MVYYDKSNAPLFLPVVARASAAVSVLDGIAQHITQTAQAHPGLTPDEVYAVISRIQDRSDITRAMVHTVLR